MAPTCTPANFEFGLSITNNWDAFAKTDFPETKSVTDARPVLNRKSLRLVDFVMLVNFRK
jgi:hypothetical protein